MSELAVTTPARAAAAPIPDAVAALAPELTRPIPGSRKIHVEVAPGVRVAMREVELADTPGRAGREVNAPVTLYDTSGPYTDPAARIDLREGLPALLHFPPDMARVPAQPNRITEQSLVHIFEQEWGKAHR